MDKGFSTSYHEGSGAYFNGIVKHPDRLIQGNVLHSLPEIAEGAAQIAAAVYQEKQGQFLRWNALGKVLIYRQIQMRRNRQVVR